MTRREWTRVLLLGMASSPAAARAQDLGKLFEKAARDSLKRTFSAEGLERSVTSTVDRALEPPRPSAARQMVPIKTPDGWTLVAHHYPPAGGRPRPDALPVILCHGLTYSASFWDLEPPVSFSAAYLASLGFDVWTVDLRGCGSSQKWVFRIENTTDVLIGGALRRATQGQLAPTGYQTVDPRYASWTLDDHINHDLPTFVRLVRKLTGAPQVAWVGHSMGGIIALCHLARYENPGIGRLVTVGSQVTMKDAQLVVPFFNELLRTRQLQIAGKPQPAEVLDATQASVANLFFNTQHVSPSIYQALSMEKTDVPALGLSKQYLALATSGELKDASGQFNYARSLANVKVPALITCGSVDRFAPPAVQHDVYSRLGSTDKTMLVFGRTQGYAADSGHDDALVGLTSRQQVFPTIARWLTGAKLTRSAPAPEPARRDTSQVISLGPVRFARR